VKKQDELALGLQRSLDRYQPNAAAEKLLKDMPAKDRRRFLKATAALAATGAAGLLAPSLAGAAEKPEELPFVPTADGTDDGVAITYDIENFSDAPPEGLEPIDPTQDYAITAHDFTRGLAVALGGLKKLDAGVNERLQTQIKDLDSAVANKDAATALKSVEVLRMSLLVHADAIDAAAGMVAFGHTVSYSEMIISLVEFLYFLGVRIVGVIWVIPSGQIIKILEVFEVFVTCFTVIRIIDIQIYIRFWLFILVARFDCFPGRRWSIDVFVLFVFICLRVRIVEVFRFCVIQVRRSLLLVEC
jgi:hypothetical protein